MTNMEEICDADNVGPSFKCVCNHLEILGFPTTDYDEENEKKVLIFSINCLWALIKQGKSNVNKINQNNGRMIQLESEIKRLQQQVKSMELAVSDHLKEINILKNKLSVVEQDKQGMTSHVTLLKKECNKLVRSSEMDRKIYLKSISDQKKLIHNENNTCHRLDEDLPGKSPTQISDEHTVQKIVNKCIQTLDNTIQNLLGEIASIRCCFMNIFRDIVDLARDVHSSLCPTESSIKIDKPEFIFQLPHSQFLDIVAYNINIIFTFLRSKILTF